MRKVIALCFLFPSLLYAGQAHVGYVIHIADGDTLTLQTAGSRILVHLAGIDAPEPDQPFGTQAKKCLGELSLNRPTRIIEIDRISSGSLVGRVSVDDTDINAELVRKGCAWVDRHSSHERELLRLEAEARHQARGLWANQSAIPPWDWRGGVRTTIRDTGTVRGMVVGNRRRQVYYLPDCPGYQQITEDERVLFITAQAAEGDGYRKAESCP